MAGANCGSETRVKPASAAAEKANPPAGCRCLSDRTYEPANKRGTASLDRAAASDRAPAVGSLDRLSYLREDPLDLLVQLVAVGDDRYAGIRVVL